MLNCSFFRSAFSPTAAAWASAVATFLAVIVALFQKEIRNWWDGPRLTLRLSMAAPDCVLMPVIAEGRKSASFYLRCWIENSGNQMAEKAQLFATRLWRLEPDRSVTDVVTFLPLNLKWAHNGTIHSDIAPHMGRHCDLGHVNHPSIGATPAQIMYGSAKTFLELNTEVQPFSLSNILAPGEYMLEVKLAANNAKPVAHRIKIVLTGDWSDDFGRVVTARILEQHENP